MTILKKHFIFSLLILCLTFSCSKNDNDVIVEQEPETTLKFKKITYGTYPVEINYNINGFPESMNTSNSNVSYNYNNDNKIISIGNQNYTYDDLGRISNISDSEATCDYIYNSKNLLISQNITVYNATYIDKTDLIIKRNYVYNDKNQLIEVTEIHNNTKISRSIYKCFFTYNNQNQLIKFTEKKSNDTASEFFLEKEMLLTYDNFKSPKRLLINNLGFEGPLFQDIFFSISTSYYSTIGIGSYVYFGLDFTPQNNILEADITTFYGTEKNTIETFTYQYDNEYPVTGQRTITLDGVITGSTQFSWEYIEEVK